MFEFILGYLFGKCPCCEPDKVDLVKKWMPVLAYSSSRRNPIPECEYRKVAKLLEANEQHYYNSGKHYDVCFEEMMKILDKFREK